MAPISSLPLDLMPLILDHLSKKDYLALFRTCKSLSKATTPYLYRDITFKAGPSRQCGRRLAYLLRTLIERPELALHVRSFRLYGSHPFWSRYNPWRQDRIIPNSTKVNLWGLEGCNVLSHAQLILLSNQFYRLVDNKELHKPSSLFLGRSKDALAALLLTRFTELTTLDLADGFLTYSWFIPHLLKRAPSLLPNLSHVILGSRHPPSPDAVSFMDLDLIRPIFYIPTIQTFECRMSEPWLFSWSPSGVRAPPNAVTLTTLHLFRSDIKMQTFAQLLSVTPNLKSLNYDFEYLSRSAKPCLIDTQALSSALSLVRTSLTHLSISLSYAPDSQAFTRFVEQGRQSPILNGALLVLKSMTKLQRIELPMIMVLGWMPGPTIGLENLLPRRIKTLVLRDDVVSYSPWVARREDREVKLGIVERWVGGKGVFAPGLEKLVVVAEESERRGKRGSKLAALFGCSVQDFAGVVRGEGVEYEVVGLRTILAGYGV